jgi:signal transduction histidine kinase
MASLGSLVAGVAHEINTPVGNAITAISRISDDREQIVRALGDGTLTERAFTDFLDSVGTAVRIIDSNLSKASQLVGTFKQVAADRATEEVREFTLND